MPNKERLIIQLDARDVLAIGSYDDFLNKLNEYSRILEDRLIIGVEYAIGLVHPAFAFPPGSFISKDLKRLKRTNNFSLELHNAYKWRQEFYKIDNKENASINAGMIMGKAKNFIKLYDIMKANRSEDDQALMYELYILRPGLFYPDFENSFFLNCIDYNFLHCQ